MSYIPPQSSVICANHLPKEEGANESWLIQTEAPYAIAFARNHATPEVDLALGIWVPQPTTPEELSAIAKVMYRAHRAVFQKFAGLGIRDCFETWNYFAIPESKVPTLFFVSAFCSSVYNRYTKQSWQEVSCDPEMRLYFDPKAPEDVVAFYRAYKGLADDVNIIPPVPMPTSRDTDSRSKLRRFQTVYYITWNGDDGKLRSIWAEDVAESPSAFKLKKVRASNADLHPSPSGITMATHRVPFESETLTIPKTAEPLITAIDHPPGWWNLTSPHSLF